MRRLLFIVVAFLALGAVAYASSVVSGFPQASQPLGNLPDAVLLDQGTGCPTNTAPCTTSQSPSVRVGQPFQSPTAPTSPFKFQPWWNTTNVNAPVLNYYDGTSWDVVGLFDLIAHLWNPYIPNAKGNGTTDDTAAVQAALNAIPSTGGILYTDPGKKYRISQNLTIPSHVWLDCKIPWGFAGTGAAANLNTLGGIRLDSSATITVMPPSRISCPILRYGATFPTQNASAFAGTAITMGGGGSGNSPDVWITNSLIVGFETAVDFSIGGDRMHVIDVDADATSCYKFGPAFDTAEIHRVRCWPWATAQYTPGPDVTRAGTAFLFTGTQRFDDGKIGDLLDSGHAVGLDIENPGNMCCNMHFTGSVWLENNATASLLINGANNLSFNKLTIFNGGGGPGVIANNIVSNGRSSIANLYLNGSASDCVQLSSAALDIGHILMGECTGVAFNIAGTASRLHVGPGLISGIGTTPYVTLPPAAGMPSDAVIIEASSDQPLLANASLLPRASFGEPSTATTAISAPTVLATGLGQTTSALTDNGNMGGTFMAKDSGNALGNGGGYLFGATSGHMRHFCALKGLLINGNNNTAGDIDLACRFTDSDPTLTKLIHFDHSGYIQFAQETVEAAHLVPCGAESTTGAFQVVKDSGTKTWGDVITGNGSYRVIAFCDGTNWTVMGARN